MKGIKRIKPKESYIFLEGDEHQLGCATVENFQAALKKSNKWLLNIDIFFFRLASCYQNKIDAEASQKMKITKFENFVQEVIESLSEGCNNHGKCIDGLNLHWLPFIRKFSFISDGSLTLVEQGTVRVNNICAHRLFRNT